MNNHDYDNGFMRVDHYQRYPAMMPFIGSEYDQTRILLIGESFYLQNGCTLNKNSETWYSSNQSQLSEYDVPWMNCRGLIMSPWDSNGHFTYKEINRCLHRSGFSGYDNAFMHVSFMNAFQRPSPVVGESIKHFVTDLDFKIARAVLNDVTSILKPKLVVFMSIYSHQTVGRYVQNDNGVVDFTCHPATGGRYWNKPSYKNGRDKFMKILTEKCQSH